MKKFFVLIMSIILFCNVFCLTGCKKEEFKWWEDYDNIRIDVLSMVPNQEKVLDSYIVSQMDHSDELRKTYHFSIPRNLKRFLRYPFTKVELYYKGEKVTTGYQSLDFKFKDSVGSYYWQDLRVIFGDYVPEDFIPETQYYCFWEFYETSNPSIPNMDGVGWEEGINYITAHSYFVEIEFFTEEN